jgi:hypothetical protein
LFHGALSQATRRYAAVSPGLLHIFRSALRSIRARSCHAFGCFGRCASRLRSVINGSPAGIAGSMIGFSIGLSRIRGHIGSLFRQIGRLWANPEKVHGVPMKLSDFAQATKKGRAAPLRRRPQISKGWSHFLMDRRTAVSASRRRSGSALGM